MHKLKAIIKNLLTEFLFKIQENRKVVAKKPSNVSLLVTESCCLQCKMCDIWKLRKKQKDLDYQTAKKIIDQLINWLGTDFQLTFAGGEPFLNKDFIKIIKYAHKKRIKTNTNSNGYTINETLAKKIIKSGLTNIFISIDGTDKEHNFIRGKKDSFNKAIEAINNLQNATSKKNQTKIFINTVISNNNLHQIIDIFYLSKKLKVSGINFQVLMPNFSTHYTSNWYKTNTFWPRDKEKIISRINELLSLKNKHPAFIINSSRDFKNFKKYLINPKLFQETETCLVGFNNFMIGPTGNMRLCYEMGFLGNILKEDVKVLWNSKKATLHRKNIIKCQRPCKLLPCNDPQIISWLKKLVTLNQ
jgi:Fe-coproporphyrin III synthase